MDKVVIKDVCLICVDCVRYAQAIASLRNCMSKCEFDRVVFLTDIELKEDGIEIIKIPRINSKEEYSSFIIKHLHNYFDTTHCLIVQWDGTILNGDCWDESFKQYDLVGAKWLYPEPEYNVGNGGFSLRSHRLMRTVARDETIDILHPCDEILGRLYRKYLEHKYQIKFAPNEVCDKFSFELNAPIQRTLGHHAFFHKPFKEHIVLRREAALGDLIMLETVISYYSEQGYQVVLDTLPQFMEVFSRYRHKVIHISQMDKRICPIRTISFDMSYESRPRQLVLKSYIELTGENIPLRNSILNFHVDANANLFDKYILIHVDETGMNHRDCQGVNWDMVLANYSKLGYQIFQIGKRVKHQVAPYINSANLETLMFLIQGASLVIGIDSSPTQLSVALGIPTVIMMGSVRASYRYHLFENIQILHTDCPSGADRFCYHEQENSVTGKICEFNKDNPPCVQFSEYSIIRAGNKLLKLN